MSGRFRKLTGLLAAALMPAVCSASAAAFAAAPASITLVVDDAPLGDVLRLLAAQGRRNLVADAALNTIRVSLRLEHVSYDEALAVLARAYGLALEREGNVTIVAAAATLRKQNEDLAAGDVHVRVYRLRYARAADTLDALKAILPANAYAVDANQNAVLLFGGGRLAERALAAIRALDVRNQQVSFEVKVVDVAIDHSTTAGLLFGGQADMPGVFTTAFQTAQIPLTATLNGLITHGRAKVLATPRIVTANNHEADLLIGESDPVSQLVSTGTQTTQSYQYIDIGVKLRLTPTIGSDGSILTDIHPEYSTVQSISGTGQPIIANRRVNSLLRVRNNETIVLAGLMQDIDAETVTRLPVLGNLPILGPVFRNRNRSHHRDEVVFLITPHVL